MAKRASPKKAAATGRKRAAAKPKKKATARKPARKASSTRRAGGDNAVDALLKLLESPLIADLFAVGATADAGIDRREPSQPEDGRRRQVGQDGQGRREGRRGRHRAPALERVRGNQEGVEEG